MNDMTSIDTYAVVTEPATLRMQRLLPGPIERVWSYITEEKLRRQWFAAGTMEPKVGGAIDLVWRNDTLTDPPGERPPGFGAEHRMESVITAYDPPYKLAYDWPGVGHVTFALEPRGKQVLLTLTHSGVPNKGTLLGVSTGWHAHLDLLAVRMSDQKVEPFWETMVRLRKDYEKRLSA